MNTTVRLLSYKHVSSFHFSFFCMLHEFLTNGVSDPDCKNNFTLPHFLDIINTIKSFEISYPEIAKDLYRRVKYKKGDILLNQGEYSKEFFFVEKGIVRSYTIYGGKPRTIQFAFPAEFSGAYSNFVLNIPSDVTLEVIANSIIWVFNWEKWDECKSQFPIIELFERYNSASYIFSINERLNDLLFLSTYERYEKLINSRPQFVKRLPLKYIADYLGCTVENISRIRSKLTK